MLTASSSDCLSGIVVGVLITFSPEFAKVLGYRDPIIAGRSIMYTYTGLIFGDFLSGFISQYFKSRKKVVAWFILLSFLFIIIYLFVPGKTSFTFILYACCLDLLSDTGLSLLPSHQNSLALICDPLLPLLFLILSGEQLFL